MTTDRYYFQRCIYALLFVLGIVILILPAKALALDSVVTVLKNDSLGITSIHQNILNTVNYLIIVILIIAAFAQILRLKVDTYGIKKVLPSLILAIIAANFSMLICRLIIDFANVAMSLLVQNIGDISDSGTNNLLFREEVSALRTQVVERPIGAIFSIILLFVITVMTYILAYLLIIRNYIIYFLVALAPLAFIATAIPQGKSVFNQWWSNFLKWTFMPVVSIFWIWMAAKWIESMSTGGGDYLKQVYAIVCYYLAMTTPWKMGGAVMSQWGNFGKKMWGRTGSPVVGAAKKAWIDNRYEALKNKTKTWYLHQANRGKPTEGKPNVSLSDKIWGNTVGEIVRRGYRSKDYQSDMKEAVGAAEDSAMREALGGKDIEEEVIDPKTGKKITVKRSRFLTREQQIAIARRKDNIASDKGEKDWILKHLDNLYKQTDEGQLAAARSVAYGYRMEQAENMAKIIKNGILAAFDLDKGNNKFKDNPIFGAEWTRLYREALQSRDEADISEKTKGKAQGDANSENALIGGKLQLWKNAYDVAENELTQIDAELQELNQLTQRGQLDEKEQRRMETLQRKRDDGKLTEERKQELRESQVRLSEDWDALRKQLIDTYHKDGRFIGPSASLQKMLTDENGNLNMDMTIDKASSLVDMIPDEAKGLAIDRMGKRYSTLYNEERQSSAGKREAEESIDLVQQWLASPKRRQSVIDYLSGKREKIDPVFERKIDAEITNAIAKAGDNYPVIIEKLNGMLAGVALDPTIDGSGARKTLVAETNRVFKVGAQTILNEVLQEEMKKEADWDDKASEETKRTIQERIQRKMKDEITFRQDMERRMQDIYRVRFGFDDDQAKLLQATISERGRAAVELTSDITNESIESYIRDLGQEVNDQTKAEARTKLIQKQVEATQMVVEKAVFSNIRDPRMSMFRQGASGMREIVDPRKKEPHKVYEDEFKDRYHIETG